MHFVDIVISAADGECLSRGEQDGHHKLELVLLPGGCQLHQTQ